MISSESNETDLWLSLLSLFVHKFNFTARSNDCSISIRLQVGLFDASECVYSENLWCNSAKIEICLVNTDHVEK